MLPKTHILFGAIFSLLLFSLFPNFIGLTGAIIIFLSSVLIDFDHYMYYIYKKKNLNLRRSYLWFLNSKKEIISMKEEEREKYKFSLLIFHGIECWILLLFLLFINRVFLFILIGILVHMTLDFIELYQNKVPFYIKFSQVYTHIKNKNKAEPV